MKTITSHNENSKLPNSCVVLGNFDGVHVGHKYLIKKAQDFAKSNNLILLVYTFEVHPRCILNSNQDFHLITTNDEKENLLSQLGVDVIYFEDFSKVRNFNATEFCQHILIEKLSAKAVFCGKNHKFAKDGLGTPEVLRNILNSLGCEVFIEDYHYVNKTLVSSSKIRLLLAEGNIKEANLLMGRNFSVEFPVIHGEQLGRNLGFPTINQRIPKSKLVPAHGVYACLTQIGGIYYPSVLNIGIKPTVTKDKKNPPIICETHIIGFDGDLYGQTVKVEFIERLRPEKKFDSLDELTNAVKKDILKSTTILESYNNNEK